MNKIYYIISEFNYRHNIMNIRSKLYTLNDDRFGFFPLRRYIYIKSERIKRLN